MKRAILPVLFSFFAATVAIAAAPTARADQADASETSTVLMSQVSPAAQATIRNNLGGERIEFVLEKREDEDEPPVYEVHLRGQLGRRALLRVAQDGTLLFRGAY